VTGNVVTHDGTEINFGSHNEGNPSFFAAMQSFNGPDTATLRYTDMDSEGVVVKVEEEQSRDREGNHATEVVGYMALWQPEQARSAPVVQESAGPSCE
jgi:hypothetical protein